MGSMTFGVGEIYSNDFLIPIAPFLRPERTNFHNLRSTT